MASEEERKFIATYTIYYDCPSCDSSGYGDIESMYSESFGSFKEVLNTIKDHYNAPKGTWDHEREYHELYELTSHGELEWRASFKMIVGGHRIHGLEFVLDKMPYVLKRLPDPKTSPFVWDERVKEILYGNSV